MSDWFHREVSCKFLVSENSDVNLVIGWKVLDDGGHIEMAPVPHHYISNFDQQVSYQQLVSLTR